MKIAIGFLAVCTVAAAGSYHRIEALRAMVEKDSRADDTATSMQMFNTANLEQGKITLTLKREAVQVPKPRVDQKATWMQMDPNKELNDKGYTLWAFDSEGIKFKNEVGDKSLACTNDKVDHTDTDASLTFDCQEVSSDSPRFKSVPVPVASVPGPMADQFSTYWLPISQLSQLGPYYSDAFTGIYNYAYYALDQQGLWGCSLTPVDNCCPLGSSFLYPMTGTPPCIG